MGHAPDDGLARANLGAGQLSVYGFGVEADIGSCPTRYAFGRRVGCRGDVVTVIFVTAPSTLAGTYVWITEDLAHRARTVTTFVPTMKRPLPIREAVMFDYLPLTDIGYLDLMAWPHQLLRPLGRAAPDHQADGWPDGVVWHYDGPPSAPGISVWQVVDQARDLVVQRAVAKQGREIRRWDVLKAGDQRFGYLPASIKVTRPQTHHCTVFHRTCDPVPLDADDFDRSPWWLRDALGAALWE